MPGSPCGGAANLKGYALYRWHLFVHGDCPKLSFGRLAALILAPCGSFWHVGSVGAAGWTYGARGPESDFY